MALSLPGNADLERLRRDAGRLQRGVRSADPTALAYAARHHPRGAPADPTTFALSDAQLVVARAYGFASWPRLHAYLRAAAPLSRDPAALDAVQSGPGGTRGEAVQPESASAVVALACLTGATLVSLPVAEAQRLGINYLQGTPGYSQLADGRRVVSYRVILETVTIGDIMLYNVDGVVQGGGEPLLGMSFLSRTEMRNDGQRMVLTKRY